MDRPPLPDPVARRARSYLAALVPAGQTSNAWHELVADVTYWGDRDELPVLRLAHQVVLQHERVAPEVAALALEDLGISSPRAVAQVLDVPTVDAEVLLDRVAAMVADAEQPSPVHVFDAEGPGPAEPAAPRGPVDAQASEEPASGVASRASTDASARSDQAPPRRETRDGAGSRAVRIGFEEDDVIAVDDWDDESDGLGARRWLAILAVLVGAAVLLWLLTG